MYQGPEYHEAKCKEPKKSHNLQDDNNRLDLTKETRGKVVEFLEKVGPC